MIQQARFEHASPILRVEDMAIAVRYYVEVLGFEAASWGDAYFTCVTRDGATLYLSKGGQGHMGGWAWLGVSDAEALYAELDSKGAKIRQPPRNYPWALEIHVEDPDGNVLRMGSDAKRDRPFEDWRG